MSTADSPFRAVVVDDVAIIREGRARELEKVGITVCGVYDFDQARRAVAAGVVTRAHLDGVVLDAHDNTPGVVPKLPHSAVLASSSASAGRVESRC